MGCTFEQSVASALSAPRCRLHLCHGELKGAFLTHELPAQLLSPFFPQDGSSLANETITLSLDKDWDCGSHRPHVTLAPSCLFSRHPCALCLGILSCLSLTSASSTAPPVHSQSTLLLCINFCCFGTLKEGWGYSSVENYMVLALSPTTIKESFYGPFPNLGLINFIF